MEHHAEKVPEVFLRKRQELRTWSRYLPVERRNNVQKQLHVYLDAHKSDLGVGGAGVPRNTSIQGRSLKPSASGQEKTDCDIHVHSKKFLSCKALIHSNAISSICRQHPEECQQSLVLGICCAATVSLVSILFLTPSPQLLIK